MLEEIIIPIAIIIGIIIFLAIFFSFVPIRLWISALASGVRISGFTLSKSGFSCNLS